MKSTLSLIALLMVISLPSAYGNEETENTSWFDYRFYDDGYYLKMGSDSTRRPYPWPELPQSLWEGAELAAKIAGYYFVIWPTQMFVIANLISPISQFLPKTHWLLTLVMVDLMRRAASELIFVSTEMVFDLHTGCAPVQLEHSALSNHFMVELCMDEQLQFGTVTIRRIDDAPLDTLKLPWDDWGELANYMARKQLDRIQYHSNGYFVYVTEQRGDASQHCQGEIWNQNAGEPQIILENEILHQKISTGRVISLLDSHVIRWLSTNACYSIGFDAEILSPGAASLGDSTLLHFDNSLKVRSFDNREGLWLTLNPAIITREKLPYTIHLSDLPKPEIGSRQWSDIMVVNKAELMAKTVEYIPYLLLMTTTSRGYTGSWSSPGTQVELAGRELVLPGQYADTARVLSSVAGALINEPLPEVPAPQLHEPMVVPHDARLAEDNVNRPEAIQPAIEVEFEAAPEMHLSHAVRSLDVEGLQQMIRVLDLWHVPLLYTELATTNVIEPDFQAWDYFRTSNKALYLSILEKGVLWLIQPGSVNDGAYGLIERWVVNGLTGLNNIDLQQWLRNVAGKPIGLWSFRAISREALEEVLLRFEVDAQLTMISDFARMGPHYLALVPDGLGLLREAIPREHLEPLALRVMQEAVVNHVTPERIAMLTFFGFEVLASAITGQAENVRMFNLLVGLRPYGNGFHSELLEEVFDVRPDIVLSCGQLQEEVKAMLMKIRRTDPLQILIQAASLDQQFNLPRVHYSSLIAVLQTFPGDIETETMLYDVLRVLPWEQSALLIAIMPAHLKNWAGILPLVPEENLGSFMLEVVRHEETHILEEPPALPARLELYPAMIPLMHTTIAQWLVMAGVSGVDSHILSQLAAIAINHAPVLKQVISAMSDKGEWHDDYLRHLTYETLSEIGYMDISADIQDRVIQLKARKMEKAREKMKDLYAQLKCPTCFGKMKLNDLWMPDCQCGVYCDQCAHKVKRCGSCNKRVSDWRRAPFAIKKLMMGINELVD